MVNTATDPSTENHPRFIWPSIFLAVGYWLIETFFDTVLIENVSFAERLFPADFNELWMRSLIFLFFIGFGLYSQRVCARLRSAYLLNIEAAQLLKNALANTIRGDFPYCALCKKIRNEDNEWVSPEIFIAAQTEAKLSPNMCKECLDSYLPNE